MIIYFEDGPIANKHPCNENGEEFLKIDAGAGFTNCRDMLWHVNDYYPFDTKVYTNSLDAFSNTWCWDEELGIPQIYIRNKDGVWTHITELTSRELRRGLAFDKLYINGEFGFWWDRGERY